MRTRTSAALAGTAATLLFLGSCRPPGAEEFAASLPELPQDLAATLDPKTLATKVSPSQPPFEKLPGVALAPCCGSRDKKSLTVNYTYTKCRPLRDFIVVKFGSFAFSEARQGGGGGQGTGPGQFKAYRRGELNRSSVLDSIVCFTSQGPWNATFIEERSCAGYSPRDTLLVNAFGDMVSFVWNGGPANHPPDVHVVSCRRIDVVKYPCNALSSCPCESSACPADQPCECDFQGQW